MVKEKKVDAHGSEKESRARSARDRQTRKPREEENGSKQLIGEMRKKEESAQSAFNRAAVVRAEFCECV